MSGLNLNAFTENATRLGMRLQESFSERTRDFSITRGGAAAYFDTGEDKLKLIRKQLDSSSDREKLDAMKRLLAMISKGRNVSEFFAQVVKNVAVPNVEVRKLVYIYILRYAEFEPDLALLSINTFQRDLSDSSPLIRAMALRVLAGIRVPSIGSLVVLAIKKTASDVSPYVRKNAALAIPKCYSLDDSHLPGLIQILQILLRDRSPLTLGAVAVAFKTLCPTRLDLLHAHFRRLCRALVDADEWGQVDLLDLLVRYARTMFPRPMEGEVDKDIALLLSSAEPLLQSNNAAVVVAVVRAIYYLGLPSEHKKVIAPLIRLLDISPEVERVVLAYVFHIAQPSPYLFTPHFLRFVVHASDSTHVKTEKVRLLRMFATSENYQALLREFIDYADDDDDTLVEHAVHAIGHIARVVPEAAQQCLAALMSFIKSQHDIVVTHAVLVLKSLVQTQLALGAANGPGPALTIIERLAYRLDEMRHPQARACVLWLVGQYGTDPTRAGVGIVGEGIAAWAPDVLRRTVKTFREETSVVKLQVISLAAKLLVLSPTDKTLIALAKHAFMLARYDINYDVRDRARVVQALLIGVVPELQSTVATSWEDVESIRTHGGVVLRREQVRVVLFEGKASVVEKDDTTDPRELLGTTTLVTGRDMRGDLLPSDWLEQGIDPALRDSPEDALPPAPPVPTAIGNFAPQGRAGGKAIPVVLQPTGPEAVSPAGSVPKKATYADLDDFYASDDDAEEEGEDEEEEEEESGDGDGDGEGESESEEVEEGEDEDGEESAEEEGIEQHEGGSKGSSSISHYHVVR